MLNLYNFICCILPKNSYINNLLAKCCKYATFKLLK